MKKIRNIITSIPVIAASISFGIFSLLNFCLKWNFQISLVISLALFFYIFVYLLFRNKRKQDKD